MNEDNLKTLKDCNLSFDIEDHSDEATICKYCGKPLGENAIRYTNGEGFCNKDCEQIYDNRCQYGTQIADAISNNIPKLYLDTDINRLKSCVLNSDAMDKILNWKMGRKGLAIIGKTGCGKTRILAMLLKRLISVDLVGIRCSLMVYYAGELERAIMGSFANKAKSYDELMHNLETCGLLVIDDFGKEKFTERYEVSVFQIFEKRAANLKPTIFTTNYKGETLKARFSDQNNYEPFSRRLNEFFDRVVFTRKER